MNNNIFEELPARKSAPAAAAPAGGAKGKEGKGPNDPKANAEKRVRQAVYDIRYRARREGVDIKQAFSQYMQNSSLNPQERTAVKAKVFPKGAVREDFQIEALATDTLTSAFTKVFFEGVEKELAPIELDYIAELNALEDRKYKVRVSDKNSGRSYVRYATREKISQLRANPNISSVEMTEYGEPYEGERSKGEQTAKTKAGKDYDGDGKVESGAKEHAGAVHNAIQRKKGGTPDGKDTSGVKEEYVDEAVKGQDADLRRAASSERQTEKAAHSKWKNSPPGTTKKPRFSSVPHTKTKSSDYADQQSKQISWHDKKTKGKFIHGMATNEEFLGEVKDKDGNNKKLDVMKGSNKIVVNPPSATLVSHNKLEGDVIAEKAPPGAKFERMVKHIKAGYAKGGVTDKEKSIAYATAWKAKNKETQKEETECGTEPKKKGEKEVDPRSIPTTTNLIKNKMRAMGLKMSYEPEGKQIDEIAPLVAAGLAAGAALAGGAVIKRAQDAAKSGVDAANKGQKIKPGIGIGNASYGMQRHHNQLRDAMKQYNSYEPEGETIDELNRYEKETGKDYKTGKSVTKGGTMGGDDSNSKVMRHMQKVMGAGRMGAGGPIRKRGEKKEPGKKPPEAGKYGSERRSPEQMVKNRRAAKQQGKDNMSSRFD
jgi:hypothetical protein